MSVNWGLGVQQNNPINAFMQAYEHSSAQKRQQQMQDEDREMRRQQFELQKTQTQQQTEWKALEQHRDKIIMGARLIREVQPKDQAGWDHVRAIAGQAGIDLTDVPPQFDLNYVNGLVQLADAFEPEKSQNHPSSVQEFEYAKGQGFTGSYMDFMEEKRGPIVANNGDGTFTIVPRSMTQQAAPQQGGVVPPPPPGFQLDGGPTPSASGNFQPGVGPR